MGRKLPAMTKQNENRSENEGGRVIFLVDPGTNLFSPDREHQNMSPGGPGEAKLRPLNVQFSFFFGQKQDKK